MINYMVFAVCAIACYTDIRYRIIPNRLTFPVILAGPFIWGIFSGWEGAFASLAGIALGMILLIVPALLGGMGGGDLKLLMALGALGGPAFTFHVFTFTCIAGAVTAAVMLAYHGKLTATLKNILVFAWWFLVSRGKVKLAVTHTKLTMPYAVCITVGVAAVILIPL